MTAMEPRGVGCNGIIARVRDSRVAFQAATHDEFVSTVEELLGRKVRAFASAVDPSAGVVFENYTFEARDGDRPAG
jgi:hypothetical protein